MKQIKTMSSCGNSDALSLNKATSAKSGANNRKTYDQMLTEYLREKTFGGVPSKYRLVSPKFTEENLQKLEDEDKLGEFTLEDIQELFNSPIELVHKSSYTSHYGRSKDVNYIYWVRPVKHSAFRSWLDFISKANYSDTRPIEICFTVNYRPGRVKRQCKWGSPIEMDGIVSSFERMSISILTYGHWGKVEQRTDVSPFFLNVIER